MNISVRSFTFVPDDSFESSLADLCLLCAYRYPISRRSSQNYFVKFFLSLYGFQGTSHALSASAASACPRSLKRAPLLYQLSSPLSTLFSPPPSFPAYFDFSLNPLCFLKSICKIRSKYRQIYFYFSAKLFQVPMFICCGHSGIAKPPQILLQQLPMILRRSLQCSSAHPDAEWNSAEEKQAMIPKI